MNALLFAPHNDDEVLFAAYQLLRYKPTVIVCLCGDGQPGVKGEWRTDESAAACAVLGVEDCRQWMFSDLNPDWPAVRAAMKFVWSEREWDVVLAPLVELGGHDQHNRIGAMVEEVFGTVSSYATYRRGHGRSRTETEVVPEAGWPALKLRAMAEYKSQIGIENTRPWFFADDAHREWVA